MKPPRWGKSMKSRPATAALALALCLGSITASAGPITIDPTSDGSLYVCDECNLVSDDAYVLVDGYIQGARSSIFDLCSITPEGPNSVRTMVLFISSLNSRTACRCVGSRLSDSMFMATEPCSGPSWKSADAESRDDSSKHAHAATGPRNFGDVDAFYRCDFGVPPLERQISSRSPSRHRVHAALAFREH